MYLVKLKNGKFAICENNLRKVILKKGLNPCVEFKDLNTMLTFNEKYPVEFESFMICEVEKFIVKFNSFKDFETIIKNQIDKLEKEKLLVIRNKQVIKSLMFGTIEALIIMLLCFYFTNIEALNNNYQYVIYVCLNVICITSHYFVFRKGL